MFDFAYGSPTYFDTIFSGRDFNFFSNSDIPAIMSQISS